MKPNRLETLLKNLPGMAYRCLNQAHWPMEFVSDGCFELCGYHRRELESQAILWGDFTHPEMIDEVDRKVRSAAEQGAPFEVEYRIITRSGEEKWVWERGRVVEVRDDGVAILEGFITDITDRKLAENALKSAQAFAQAVVESAVEAVITLDSEACIASYNRAAQLMFDYGPDDMQGKHSRTLMPTSYYREYDRFFGLCKAHSTAIKGGLELQACRHDGAQFPIHLSISEIGNEPQQKYVMLIRDLTQQRAAEQEVREQRGVLAHVDRLNTLGEMAAGIAHEINQPLTAISMYAQSGLRFLKDKTTSPARLQDALEKLSNQAHRAGAIIERMQEMTKQRDSHQHQVDCLELLAEVHKLAEVEAQIRSFNIVLRAAPELPEVVCDPIQIHQVVLNLLRNGMESMKASNCKSGSKIILQAELIDQSVKISIIDCGGGITRQISKQLYQPFTSTKESGMGLGLSISRSIIAAHGSSLEFENNKSAGASFYFSLPLVAGSDA